MQALLLDLRQNPGGILGESVRVAQYLVPKGPIVSVIDREGRKYTEESYLEQVKYPLAVLVDHAVQVLLKSLQELCRTLSPGSFWYSDLW